MTTRTVTSPGCLNGMEMWPGDFDREPPIAYLCPDCRCGEDRCFKPGCCDPCAERAKVCPAGRHSSPDMDGLTLAMHQRGHCGCGGAK